VRPIRTLSSRVVYENPWLRLREDEIERIGDDGVPHRGVYAVVEKEDFAVVVPWDGETVTLVGQYRHTLGRHTWELPQGSVEGVPPEEVARTELAEETGLRAGALRHLGRFDGAVGMSRQGFHVWLATDLRQGEARPEGEEVDMTTRRVTPAQLDGMIRAGELTDAHSVAAWFRVRQEDVP
jgi:8-oxo-dGDP phosphatase